MNPVPESVTLASSPDFKAQFDREYVDLHVDRPFMRLAHGFCAAADHAHALERLRAWRVVHAATCSESL